MASKLISTSRSTIRVMRDRLRVVFPHGPMPLDSSRELGSGHDAVLGCEGIVGMRGVSEVHKKRFRWVRRRRGPGVGLGQGTCLGNRRGPSRVFAVGDSAGGHIVLALALGLGAASKVNPPSAVVAGWPAVGTEPRHWLTYCADEFDMETCKEWADTPAQELLNGTAAGNNVFLPPGKHRATEEGTHQAIEGVLSQIFMLHGKRAYGMLPPQYDAERAQALSLLARSSTK